MWCDLLCVPASWWIRLVYVGAVICSILHQNFAEHPFYDVG
jgi:hypothetical protein